MQALRTIRPRRITTLGAVLLAAALAAAGCGGDDNSSDDDSKTTSTETSTSQETTSEDDASGDSDSSDEGTVLDLSVVPGELKFDKTELEAPAGTITIKFKNPDAIPHNVAIEIDGKTYETELITRDTVKSKVELDAGEHEFVCTPHEGAGMKGMLTVT